MTYYKQLTCLLSLTAVTALAQSNEMPAFHTIEYEDESIIKGMSDNGLWAVSSGGEGTDTRLIDLTTFEATVISSEQQLDAAQDVTDDGTLVVGSYAKAPAYYSTATGQWTQLPVSDPYIYGNAYSITPDGHWAVGVLYYNDGTYSIPALWDMTDHSLVDIYTGCGLPEQDMSHQNQGMMDFRAISADGRYMLGCMSYSYLPTSEDLGGCFYFVYDKQLQTYHPIGFTETTEGRWTPLADGIVVIMEAAMSNNGHFVTGNAHLARDVEGTDYADEYEIPFCYDVENDTFTAYDETMAMDTYGSAVANDGTVCSASPVGTPVREWSVRSGKYWFSLTEILKQKYGTTFNAQTGMDNTGTVSDITNDGKRLVAFPDPYKCYVLDLPEPLCSIAEGIKLLGSYSATPAEGSQVSHLKSIQVTFDRPIRAVGGSNSAMLIDADGNTVYTSVGFSAEGKTLSIRFRNGLLAEGQTYQLFIPEGTVCLSDDATQINSDIYISYVGREDAPVSVTAIYPAEGNAISLIDYSTNPVMLTYNTTVAIADSASACLYRNDEEEPYCSLHVASSGNRIALYPSTTQYLYDGSTYRVHLAAGSITDVAGNNGCEALDIDYIGNYVREISADDVILFSDNFDSGLGNFMQWCGDQNTPTDAMVGWDFQKGMAWGLVREDNESADLSTASHSMYSPAGQSDDWLVLPQIYIPDMLCSMNFLSQSYKLDKQDVLKVIVWESNNVYNTLNASIIEQMKSEGVTVYEQLQNPGEGEETLNGEWMHNNISLADWAGKNIYIALVNQNNDQSAIFVDSLEVRHDMTYLVTLNYATSVVAQDNILISGSITGNNADKAYDTAALTLRDGQGNVIDTYTASGLGLAKDSTCTFAFTQPLPLTIGLSNAFTILANLDGEENELKGTVKDLAFQPVKRVVLEEYSGRTCGNCPLGILGMERLEERYGDQFLPISIHAYGNDPLGNGLTNYVSLLGLDQKGAPSGIVNRIEACYPAVSATVDDVPRYFFSCQDAPAEVDKLWADYVDDEMSVPAECGIDLTLEYDASTQCLNVPCQIKYALNASNLNVNLFAALVEDNVSGLQANYMSGIDSPDLGDWGLGGRYGQSYVTDYLHQDVCRNIVGLTINGTGGYLPASVQAGVTYDAVLQMPIPSTVGDLNECKVIVMMIDANTGKVINAGRAAYNGGQGIDPISNDCEAEPMLYNLAGQRVNHADKGLYIINGKKVIIK